MLSSHMGVMRLMDMMAERDAIRNEALLLLIRLTRDSVDIQKIAAFEGAFERVLSIVRCAWLALIAVVAMHRPNSWSRRLKRAHTTRRWCHTTQMVG